jgi:hypothetical protein
MDSPNPDSGEEYYHTNTQLYNVIDDRMLEGQPGQCAASFRSDAVIFHP